MSGTGSRSQTPASANTRRRKRPTPSVFSGLPTSYEDKDNDFVCPICFNMIEEAYMTKCGHTFCLGCIQQSLEQTNRCPKCNFTIERKDDIFPNFTLNELILKKRQKASDQKKAKLESPNGLSLMANKIIDNLDQDALDLPGVNYMLEVLDKKKSQLEKDCKVLQNQELKEFLEEVLKKKKEQQDQINRELSLIDTDISRVEEKMKSEKLTAIVDSPVVNGIDRTLTADSGAQDGFNGSKSAGRPWLHTTMASRRKKIQQHFDDLEQCYFTTRQQDLILQTPQSSETPKMRVGGVGDGSSLEEFTESLSKFVRFTGFRTLASLNYASDIYNASSIVSSIEFDRDCDYFAIAGVTKKIKVFEYGTVIRDKIDVHYPVKEMVCNSKISSVVWSTYYKNLLASSDYEGTVTLWDVFTGVKSRIFQEHEKRCWSVDFNRMDPKLLASGSDDSKVKLWYTNTDHSVASIEAKANVCCVKFNPDSRFHLAFGSADHCVHYYDLRNPKEPLNTFKGHRKAVSYTKFINSNEIVSASTDSQLKSWNLKKSHCLRTFRGHTNEKNFVGLASDGDYVACGSENNSLYIYYKGLSKHILTYKFDTVKNVLERDRKDDDSNEFVSAVCWRPGSNVVVAANSQGTIKVLELV